MNQIKVAPQEHRLVISDLKVRMATGGMAHGHGIEHIRIDIGVAHEFRRHEEEVEVNFLVAYILNLDNAVRAGDHQSVGLQDTLCEVDLHGDRALDAEHPRDAIDAYGARVAQDLAVKCGDVAKHIVVAKVARLGYQATNSFELGHVD